MIQYTPANQLTLDGFSHPFDRELSSDNRWVKLSALVPWVHWQRSIQRVSTQIRDVKVLT